MFNLGSISIIYTTNSRYITHNGLPPQFNDDEGWFSQTWFRVSGTIYNAYYRYTVLYMFRSFAFVFIIIFSFHRIVYTHNIVNVCVCVCTPIPYEYDTQSFMSLRTRTRLNPTKSTIVVLAALTCVQFDYVHYTLGKTYQHIHDVNITFWPFDDSVHMIIIRAHNILFKWHSKVQFLYIWRPKHGPRHNIHLLQKN